MQVIMSYEGWLGDDALLLTDPHPPKFWQSVRSHLGEIWCLGGTPGLIVAANSSNNFPHLVCGVLTVK